MMKPNKNRTLWVLLISLSLLYNSCSVIGYKLGAKLDSGIKIVDPADYETIKIWQINNLNVID